MLKRIKENFFKNKVFNQIEITIEEEKKFNFDYKKFRLRTEILKQFDYENKQKERLQDKLKRENKNKISLSEKKSAKNSIVNKFIERGL
jgi:hypothetical protein